MNAKLEQTIREFHDRATEIERVLDVMNDVLKMEPECALNGAVWALIGGYIDAISAAYCIEGWLEWWWHECRLGENPMQASLTNEPMRTIATIDDLARIVLDDIERGPQ